MVLRRAIVASTAIRCLVCGMRGLLSLPPSLSQRLAAVRIPGESLTHPLDWKTDAMNIGDVAAIVPAMSDPWRLIHGACIWRIYTAHVDNVAANLAKCWRTKVFCAAFIDGYRRLTDIAARRIFPMQAGRTVTSLAVGRCGSTGGTHAADRPNRVTILTGMIIAALYVILLVGFSRRILHAPRRGRADR